MRGKLCRIFQNVPFQRKNHSKCAISTEFSPFPLISGELFIIFLYFKKKVLPLLQISIPKFGMHISKFGMYIPKLGTEISKFETKKDNNSMENYVVKEMPLHQASPTRVPVLTIFGYAENE